MYSRVLRSELFGSTVPQADLESLSPDPLLGLGNGINEKTRSHTPPSHVSNLPPASITPSTPHKNLFNYASPRGSGHPTPSKTPRSQHGPNLNVRSELYSLSPIRYDSQRILETPRKQPRYVNKVPYKVLDAPDLQDDFYLNLVDWGSSNVLGVGLGNSVYMWNSQSGTVTKLCELRDDTVTSVNWIQRVSNSKCIAALTWGLTETRTGYTSCYRDWEGTCADLGCRTLSPSTHDDWPYQSCRCPGLE